MRGRAVRALAVAALAAVAACEPAVEELAIEVVGTLPHDPSAYTQGLVFHDGKLYESTGRYGSSRLLEIDAETGEVLRTAELADEYFGEGLALVGDELVQLTWQEGVALVWDLATFELERAVEVGTHGWGLCFDGELLQMTTGGSILFRRDPVTLEIVDQVQITENGAPLSEVNELECVGEHLWANVYQTDDIVKIDKATGAVIARLEASGLVPEELRGDPDAVLNGIARDPSSGTFFLTGKLWPSIHRVLIVPR